jgi:intracellular multiplication protein IcmV
MPLKDALKVSRKTFFNPSGWLGYDMLRTQFAVSWRIIKSLFVLPEATTAEEKETFEEAKDRFKLTDEQVERISKNLLTYTIIFTSCGVATFVFAIYLLFYYGTFAGFIVGISATAVFLAYAFRYSFWRFEVKYRKLGCTFEEWMQGKPKEDTRHGD